MSANLDLVRSICAAWDRGDYRSVEWADPSIEYVLPDAPLPVKLTGTAQMADAWRDFLDAWESVRTEVEEYRELPDGEHVLALVSAAARGKRSGLDLTELRWKGAQLFQIREGKVTRLVNYTDRAHALADLGLAAEEATLTPAEKLALGQRSYAAFNAGPDIDALLPVWHPQCEWRMGSMGAAFGAESFRGHDGLRAWVAAIDEGWKSFAVEIDEARITGEGVVLVRSHAHGRSRDTHIELSIPAYWQRSTFRDGLIFSVEHLDEPPPEWDDATPITPEAG
jgi:ketosteroid isomerase-like protein